MAIFATLIPILITYIGGIFMNDGYAEKFNEIPLGINLDEIKTEWG